MNTTITLTNTSKNFRKGYAQGLSLLKQKSLYGFFSALCFHAECDMIAPNDADHDFMEGMHFAAEQVGHVWEFANYPMPKEGAHDGRIRARHAYRFLLG